MSEEEQPLQFSARDLMPDWAQERSTATESTASKRFEQFEGERGRRGGGRRDERRGDRRDGFRGRRDDDSRRERGPRRDSREGASGPGRPGGRRDDRDGAPRGDRRDRGDRRGGPGRGPRDRDREEVLPQNITVAIEPSRPAVEGLSKHIRETSRSFPVADLAKMILNARERYQVRFTATESARLYRCPSDGSVWLSRDEALSHLLHGPSLEWWYAIEDVEVEAPSGNYSVIAVCGMSGTLLGPPNHHEYQRNIARLHREKFSHLPLERLKSRIRMESGEEVIEKWKEQVSRVRRYRVRTKEEQGRVDGPTPNSDKAASEEVAPEARQEDGSPDHTEKMPAVAPEGVVEASEGVEASAEETPETSSEPSEAPVAEAAPEEVSEEAPAAELEEAPAEEASAEEASADESTNEEAEAAAEVEVEEVIILDSIEEVTRHFRQTFAKGAIREAKVAVVPGNVPGRLLSPPLLALLRNEGERLRRSFPLSMIQLLCRGLEKTGMRFFKRGKKSLYVSAVRPKVIDESVVLTEQIQAIIDYVKADPKAKVVTLLASLDPEFKSPGEELSEEAIELTELSKSILKDLRWLTSEGYVLEFSDMSLALGRPRVEGTAPAAASTEAPDSPTGEKKKKSRRARGKASSSEETSDSPEVSSDSPEVSSDSPEVSSDSPEVSSDSPEVSSDSPEASSDSPEVSSDSPEVSSDSPEVSSDSPGEELPDPTDALQEKGDDPYELPDSVDPVETF